METTQSVLANFNAWVPVITVVVLGVFAGFSLLDKNQREKAKRADELDNKVINRLEQTVAALEAELEAIKKDRHQDQLKIEAVVAENKTLREVLQGRDKSTLEYQRAGLEAMKRGEQVLEIVSSNSQNIERLANLLEKHFKVIEQNINN